jgi:hypothetical protein
MRHRLNLPVTLFFCSCGPQIPVDCRGAVLQGLYILLTAV